jgi:hypothetical protein
LDFPRSGPQPHRKSNASIADQISPGVRLMTTAKRNAGFQTTIGFVLPLIVAILPTLLVRIPASEDYLNHLGRMYILTTATTNEPNPYYQVSWALYPYLAMDIIVPLLGRVMDVETAGWFFYLASQLLVVTGAIALELSVKRRHELAGVAALLTIYSMPFSLGLVNFEFGTGIALWGVASWIALARNEDWRPRIAVHIVFTVVLFLSHIFALGIYGLTIGVFELRRIFASKFDIRRTSITFIMLVCPVLVMLFLMKETGATIGEVDNEWSFAWKPIWLALFLNGYSISLAAGSAAALAVLLSYLVVKRRLSISIDGKWIGLAFLFVFLAMPFKLFGSRMADIRVITAAFLILPAFVTFAPKEKLLGYLAALITGAIICINISYVAYVWFSYRSDYADMKESFALIRQGSFVLVGSGDTTSSTLLTDAPIWRAPTLAVYYAKAFVSSLYTIPGTHAVEVRPDLKHLDVDNRTETYAPPSLATLEIIAHGGQVPHAPRYIRNWTCDFDYLYLLGPPRPNILPDVLDQLVAQRRFTLYRVRKSCQ